MIQVDIRQKMWAVVTEQFSSIRGIMGLREVPYDKFFTRHGVAVTIPEEFVLHGRGSLINTMVRSVAVSLKNRMPVSSNGMCIQCLWQADAVQIQVTVGEVL